jgi:hypothetical protein
MRICTVNHFRLNILQGKLLQVLEDGQYSRGGASNHR